MIGVLTHHWSKDGTFDKARALLDGNGLAQSKARGFISRITLLSREDPSQITSIVVWENDGIYDEWKQSKERELAMQGSASLWAKSPASQRFDIP